MGLKLNKFSTFVALCNNDDPVVNRFFDSFKLTAILLCDQNDRDIINEVNRNFGQLSKITDEGLLFITFTQAGDSIPYIGNYARRSLGMSEDEIRCLQEALAEDITMDRMNLSELARQFHVDVEQLPVIVLTDNIKSNQALIIPTTAKDVYDQLVLIGARANRRDFHGSLDEIEVDRIGPYTELIRFKKGIVNMLTDVMSRIQLKLDPSDRDAIRWNNDAVSKNIQRLWEMNDSDNTIQERFDELMDYSSNRTARLSVPRAGSPCPFQIAEEKMRGSEEDTLMVLNTYNLFSTLLDDNAEIQRHDPVHHLRRYDYSALSVCLGKMFENELSYSIVQQMRKCIGIPMPEFFGKYYQGQGSFVVKTDNDFKIDLNKSKSKRKIWVAPSIGDAKAAYEQLSRDFMERSLATLHRYVALWDDLNTGRNAASHRNPLDKGRFRRTFDDFSNFLDGGFFSELVRIKRQLRGGAS